MLVLSQAEGKKDLIIHALKNNFEADAYFVKVMGKSPICPACSVSPSSLHAQTTGRRRREEHHGKTLPPPQPSHLALFLPLFVFFLFVYYTQENTIDIFFLCFFFFFTLTAPPRPIKISEHEKLFSLIWKADGYDYYLSYYLDF